MIDWLRGLLAAILLMAAPATAQCADIRVGFISPTGPPEFWSLLTATMQAAAQQLGIVLEVRDTLRSRDKAITVAKDMLAEQPSLDYLIASNDLGVAGDIIKLADAAHVKLILLNNDLTQKEWAEFGEPRTKYPSWLGSLVPDHEAAGYGIATAILTEAAKVKTSRPLRMLALTGDANTPGAVERARGMQRGVGVMSSLMGPNSVELAKLLYLDWSENAATAATRDFLRSGPRIDALWAANDPMALGAINALGEAGYRPGRDVLVGGLNWSQPAVDRILKGEMVLTHGGHFLLGAWSMVLLRDFQDGRDFADEDVRVHVPMGAIDLAVARRFPEIGKVDWRQVDFTRFAKSRNAMVKRYDFSPESVLAQLKPVR